MITAEYLRQLANFTGSSPEMMRVRLHEAADSIYDLCKRIHELEAQLLIERREGNACGIGRAGYAMITPQETRDLEIADLLNAKDARIAELEARQNDLDVFAGDILKDVQNKRITELETELVRSERLRTAAIAWHQKLLDTGAGVADSNEEQELFHAAGAYHDEVRGKTTPSYDDTLAAFKADLKRINGDK